MRSVKERTHWTMLIVIDVSPKTIDTARANAAGLNALELPLIGVGIANTVSTCFDRCCYYSPYDESPAHLSGTRRETDGASHLNR
jgi:methylase of polypeptide subunit release factors